MKFYAYPQDVDLGQEKLGTEGKLMFELKTVPGAIRRVKKVYGPRGEFRLFTYTNFYDNTTFRQVAARFILKRPDGLPLVDLKRP